MDSTFSMSFFTRATADGGMYLLTCLPRAPFDLNLYCEQVGVGLGINRATRKRLNVLESHPRFQRACNISHGYGIILIECNLSAGWV